ncbi:MAG: alpha/beta hydrolase [Roseibium album]|uniref:serine aminopeptidase domain-containing protein n=1 Tax=Roseibium album TaxID=311410 RepID=UPI0032ED3C2D
MSGGSLYAEFVDADEHRLLVTWRLPQATVVGTVLVVPALAEEMNKCRPILRDLGQRLGSSGWALCIPDLTGTGDSEGRYEAAGIDRWCRDLESVAQHAEARVGPVSVCLAVRAGALIAARWLSVSGQSIGKLVLWQPVANGNQVVNQWLRLRAMASMFDGRESVSKRSLREMLNQGSTIECGGYRLTARFARELEALNQTAPPTIDTMVVMEIGGLDRPSAACGAPLESGSHARCVRVPGEPFWSSTEIVRNDALVQETVEAITGREPPP